MMENQKGFGKYITKKNVLLISAILVCLLIIAGAGFSYFYFYKIKKQCSNPYIFSFDPYERIFSGTAATIKEIDLNKKEIKAEMPISAIRKSPCSNELVQSKITYKEFVLKIAPDAVLKGTEKWEDVKPGQKTNIILFNAPGNDDLILKELTVLHPGKR